MTREELYWQVVDEMLNEYASAGKILDLIDQYMAEVIGKPSEVRTSRPSGSYEAGFDHGYDQARNEIIERSGINVQKKK